MPIFASIRINGRLIDYVEAVSEHYLCRQVCYGHTWAAFWRRRRPACFSKGLSASLSSFCFSPKTTQTSANQTGKASRTTTAGLSPHLQQLLRRHAELGQNLGDFMGVFGESVGHGRHHGSSFPAAALWQEEPDVAVGDQTPDGLMEATSVASSGQRTSASVWIICHINWGGVCINTLTAGASCTESRRCPRWFWVAPLPCSPSAAAGCRPGQQLPGWWSDERRWNKPKGSKPKKAEGSCSSWVHV